MKKNESMILAVDVILAMYCECVYEISVEHYDIAMSYVQEEELVKRAMKIHISQFVEDFDYYKKNRGNNSEKLEDIDLQYLYYKLRYLHKRYVKEIIVKNIESNRKGEDRAYWKLKISELDMF